MIRATFHKQNGIRTGHVTVCGDRHELATWHRAADGVLLATTDQGVPVTLTAGTPGCGTLSMAGRLWSLRRIVRDGDVVVGEAMEVPRDQWMDAAFGEGWDE